MNTYKGLKSTDAEIILDLEKGKAFFDYSLNKFGWIMDSNSSCVLSKSGKHKVNIADEIIDFFLAPIMIFFVSPVIDYKLPQYQYKYQKFLKWHWAMVHGMEIQTSVGKLTDTKKIFNIRCNIWFEYVLDGDYKEKIKKISLLRHFTIIEKRGIQSHRQSGWDVVFEFNEPPQYGYCVVRSIP